MNNQKDKPLKELFSELNFKSAFDSNISLYDAESECKTYLYQKFRNYIYVWEYGYYFLSYFIVKSAIDRSEAPIASLIADAHSSLRGSFLLNITGYHPESIALLRKAHESCIKAIAIRKYPRDLAKIIMAKGVAGYEAKLGLDLKVIYNLESSFVHSNRMQLMKIGIDLSDKDKKIEIGYGPQINDQQFSLTAKDSLTWIYALIRVAPTLFPRLGNDYWNGKQEKSLELLKYYLVETKSNLSLVCEQFDDLVDRVEK